MTVVENNGNYGKCYFWQTLICNTFGQNVKNKSICQDDGNEIRNENMFLALKKYNCVANSGMLHEQI
jgi:hypothetical protein